MKKREVSFPMVQKYINPFTDFGFKKIFGSEPNKDLLIDFLNELLKTKEKIVSLTYKKTEHLGFTEEDRKAIFDLYCENEKGEKFIVELQKVKQKFFKDRSLFYATFPIQEQGNKGEWDYELKSVYCVGILDFKFNDEDKDKLVVDEVKLLSTKTKKVFYDKLTFVYVQMPNFEKTEAELETHEDSWLYLLKNLHKFERIPVKLQDKIFQKVFKIAEIAKYTPVERQKYIDSLKYYLDLKNSFDTAREEGREMGWEDGWHDGWTGGREKGLQEGLQKGIEEGLELGKQKGIEEGLELGKQKGIEEGLELGKQKGIEEGLQKGMEEAKIKLAIEFYKVGVPIENIAAATQLTIEQVKQILHIA